MLEIQDNVAKENTIPDENGQMIKTFKFSATDQKKITIKFRAAEGLQQGNLSFFVIPQDSSLNNTCAVIEIPLKPLNQHERITSIPQELLEQLPWSTLTVTGSFTYADGVNWCSHFVPSISQS